MAKALIISDIHGNIHALEAIWKKEKDSDLIYCAGDLVDPGQYAKEVLRWVQDKNVVCVKGNHDNSFVKAYKSNDESWKKKNMPDINDTDIKYLDNLPLTLTFEIDSITYCLQHSYQGYNVIKSEYYFDKVWNQISNKAIKSTCQKRLILGHTHLRAIYYLADDKLCMNPGSCHYRAEKNRTIYGKYDKNIGYQPYEPSKDAHYITITDKCINLKSVSYDWSKYANGFLGVDFQE